MIDICDFAVGLSRQLHGLTIASERPGHRLMETWHPIGPVGVISAFNFPVAVWSWNAALAIVCGDPVIWKPSDKTPLTALACQALFEQAAADTGCSGRTVSQVVLGGADVGAALVAHDGVADRVGHRLDGDGPQGRRPVVAARFGRAILELGGNNAAIVAPSADLDLARARHRVLGGRHRRPALHHAAAADRAPLDPRRAGRADRRAPTRSLPIGNPLADGTLVGPLVDGARVRSACRPALAAAGDHGGTVVAGGERALADEAADAFYARAGDRRDARARPTSCAPRRSHRSCTRWPTTTSTRRSRCTTTCPQGLASSIFTLNVREAERFMSAVGQRLRHRQRQHRPVGRRDRRGVRRREGDRRRPRVGLRRVEGLHAPRHEHDQLLDRAAARPGRPVRHRLSRGRRSRELCPTPVVRVKSR